MWLDPTADTRPAFLWGRRGGATCTIYSEVMSDRTPRDTGHTESQDVPCAERMERRGEPFAFNGSFKDYDEEAGFGNVRGDEFSGERHDAGQSV